MSGYPAVTPKAWNTVGADSLPGVPLDPIQAVEQGFLLCSIAVNHS